MRRIIWVVPVIVVVLLALTAIARPTLRRTIWWWPLALVVAVAVLLLLLCWLLRTVLQYPKSSPWRAHVRTAATAINHELKALPPGHEQAQPDPRSAVKQAVEAHLRAACEAARPPDKDQRRSCMEQLVDWWTGTSVEDAYENLHKAEIALTPLLSDEEIKARIPEALARLQTMSMTDPRRREAEKRLDLCSPESQVDSRLRAAFRSAVRIGFEFKDQQHERLRDFRNIVLAATVGLTVLVVAACLVDALEPDALPLCYRPTPTTIAGQGTAKMACPSGATLPTAGTHAHRLPAPGDVTLVALLGMLGGGLSAAFAIRHLQGSPTPYDVPVALLLLKLPSGALSALLGLLFVLGGFVSGLSLVESQIQILAYAFVFGVAQELVTRLVDRQAQAILATVPSKEPTSATHI